MPRKADDEHDDQLSHDHDPDLIPGPTQSDVFRRLIEQLPVITYEEHVKQGRYPEASMIYISPEFTRLTGHTSGPYRTDPGYFWDSIIHPDDHEMVLKEAKRTTETGEPYTQEFRMLRKDGSVLWVFDVAVLVETRGDGTQVWVGAELDITERKLAEQALEESESKYRDLVERLPATVYLMEGTSYDDARFIYLNPQATPMGYHEQDYLDDPNFWKQIVHRDDIERVEEVTRAAMDAGEPYALEYREVSPDGRIQWTRDEARVVRTDSDGTMLWQGITFDITERKTAELQLEETITLLQQTDRARRGLLTELVQAEETERARIADDLHDDSVQALTALGLRLDLLKIRAKEAGFTEDVEGLRQMVESIVDRLRKLMFDLRPRILDDEGLVAAVVALLERLESEGGTATHLEEALSHEPPEALRAILYRLVRECLVNVQKHAEAAHVNITLKSDDGGVRVTVRDDGIGFDPQHLTPTAGHLGLDSMRDRAQSASGWLTVASEPGTGTTVEFWLPTATAPGR